MKKYLFIFLILLIFIPNVKADTNVLLDMSSFKEVYSNFMSMNTTDHYSGFNSLYEEVIFERNKHSEYKYYLISYDGYSVILYLFTSSDLFDVNVTLNGFSIKSQNKVLAYEHCYGSGAASCYNTGLHKIEKIMNISFSSYIESNIDFYLPSAGVSYQIDGLYDNSITIKAKDKIPSLKDLDDPQILSYYTGIDLNYEVVHLDLYDFVILSLKDYSVTKAFDSSLLVKGSIGITPVYNYGTLAKDVVVGNKITDRCNSSYNDYKLQKLYLTDMDLNNHSVYYIKECSQGSSFKYDPDIFDITYVDSSNRKDPIINIGGKSYHALLYEELPSTVTQNEKENFIPGQSGDFNVMESVNDGLTSFWGTLTTFMSLITKFFNTLPLEIRMVCITSFTTACTLGVIKFLK